MTAVLRIVALVASGALSLHLVRAGRTESLANPKRYLIVSSPENGTVHYAKIPEGGLQGVVDMQVLISDLVNPQGLAVDLQRGQLVVSDTGQNKIVIYHLAPHGGRLVASQASTLANNTDARWVAVDTEGAVFFTEETNNRIMKIPPRQTGPATIAYDGSLETSLNAPGGLALDSFSMYWVNKALGTQVGSVVKGPKPSPTSGQTQLRQLTTGASPQSLVKNSDKSYGVCLAMNNVFYTQPESTIFGITQADTDGAPTVVTDRLTNPRGCVFDGDGTVYVADKGANAVYSFAGNMQTLSYATVTKVADMPGAFGVAVFVSSNAHRAGTLLLFLVPAAVMRLLLTGMA